MKRLNEKDWLKLSTYIDGELSSNEKSAFEDRIRQEPELMEAFENVKWTKALLKNAPRRAVPHQFVMTHQMANAAQKKSRWNVWRYGMVSGIASIVFLILAGIQFLPAMGMSGNLAMAPKEMIEEEVALMEAPMVMEEAVMEPEAMEMQADAAADFAEESVEQTEDGEMMEMAEESEEVVPEEFVAEEAEMEANEPSGGGEIPPTQAEETNDVSAMPKEEENIQANEVDEMVEAAPRADETFAMSEDEELNEDLAGMSEFEQEIDSFEFVPDEPVIDWFSVQNILLIGGMILSAVIAVLALVAAFRNRNRF